MTRIVCAFACYCAALIAAGLGGWLVFLLLVIAATAIIVWP